MKGSNSKNVAIVTVTSNRGLAGGYNANIVRMVMGSGFDKDNVRLYTVGRKGAEGLLLRLLPHPEDHEDHGVRR